MDVHTAIDLALAGSDCRAVWMDGQTARIERRPRPLQVAAAKPPLAAPPVADLAEVVVTASKRGLDVFDLPGSVSVVQVQALSAVRVRDTADLRLLASGMTVTNLGPGRDKVLLRGLSDGAFTGHTQSTVGLYWNQTPTTYNAPDPDLRLVDVQSVEVLRGPSGHPVRRRRDRRCGQRHTGRAGPVAHRGLRVGHRGHHRQRRPERGGGGHVQPPARRG